MNKVWRIVNRSFICIKIYKGSLFRVINNYQKVNSILDHYELLINSTGVSFYFDFFYDIFTNTETMSLYKTEKVVANSAWAMKLVLCHSDDLENEFLITAGHEMTHLNDFLKDGYANENKKFINWVNEVHADFSGAKIMANSSKEKLLSCIDYKIYLKSKNKHTWLKKLTLKLIGSTHPSWQQRRIYVETGAFDEKLIKEIAKITGCMNQELIDKVIDYYKPIILE